MPGHDPSIIITCKIEKNIINVNIIYTVERTCLWYSCVMMWNVRVTVRGVVAVV